MTKLSQYELEREANIARNKLLLEQLELKQAVEGLGIPKSTAKSKAKPIQPAKREKRKRDSSVEAPRRQSARLRSAGRDPNESPAKRRKRELEEEQQRAVEEEERLKREEAAQIARRPRHNKLDFINLIEKGPQESATLITAMEGISKASLERVGDFDDFVFEDSKKESRALQELRNRMQGLKVHARAKVTKSRIYCAAYHPEITKDIIFFGDKEGQLGIWDARAAPDETEDGDGEIAANESQEGGKYWRMQVHWPASPKSSISSIKVDPIDAHNIYTGSYDTTVRAVSFVTGQSSEIYASDNLVCCVDVAPFGHELWLSDSQGWATHLDTREPKSKSRSYALSEHKIGSISINPTRPHFLVTASNSRFMKLWDVRKLQSMVAKLGDGNVPTPPSDAESGSNRTMLIHPDTVSRFVNSQKGKGCLRGEWQHDKSATAAYWDPRGRQIVSTSYDDTLRLWNFDAKSLDANADLLSLKPFSRVKHNCQTGKWVTLLKAQWTRNPEVYPYFTIGNMNHSLDIYSCKGDTVASLSDPNRITAVQAVTASHPSIIERVVSGNASGRCVLWAPEDL